VTGKDKNATIPTACAGLSSPAESHTPKNKTNRVNTPYRMISTVYVFHCVVVGISLKRTLNVITASTSGMTDKRRSLSLFDGWVFIRLKHSSNEILPLSYIKMCEATGLTNLIVTVDRAFYLFDHLFSVGGSIILNVSICEDG